MTLGIIKALEAHVATLKEQLAAAEGKASEEANALREHNATLKAEIESLKAELGIRNSELVAANDRAGAEAVKTVQAIRAFENLADRLEELIAARRPCGTGSWADAEGAA